MTKETKDKLSAALVLAGVTTLGVGIFGGILCLVGMLLYGLFVHLTIPTIIFSEIFLTALAIFYFKPDVLDIIEGKRCK